MNNPHMARLSLTLLAVAIVAMAALFVRVPLGLLGTKLDHAPAAGVVTYRRDEASLESVSALPPSAFRPVHRVANFGYRKGTYWFRLELDYLKDAGPQVIKLAFPIINLARLHYEIDDTWQQQQAGIDLRHRDWSFQSRDILFKLDPGALSRSEVYLELRTEHALQAPLAIIPEHRFAAEELVPAFLWGAFYGFLMLMFLYNSFVYTGTRDPAYLYYVGYIAGTLLFVSANNGIGYQYIWPEFPGINADLGTVFPCLLFAFAVQFTREFLHVARTSKRLDRVLVWVRNVNVALLLAALPVSVDLNLVTSFLADVTVLIVLFAGFHALWLGSREARFFVVGWVTFLLSIGVYAASMMGALPVNLVTAHAKEVGIVVEVLLLSLALADRIRTLSHENDRVVQERAAALSVANDALVENLKVKDEFLATVSHELRTPMNGVMGSLESLADTGLDTGQAGTVEMAYSSALEMYELVEKMLDFSEVQSRSLNLRDAPFDFKASLDLLATAYARKAEEKGLKFGVVVQSTCPQFLHADGLRLLQVVNQLLDNALKFTQEGSVYLVAGLRDGRLRLTLTDTGIGIPMARADDVFKPFTQADGSFSRKYGGLGIGLALVQALVNLMGGEIAWRSLEGRGSLFTLTLPARPATNGPVIDVETRSRLGLTPVQGAAPVNTPVNASVGRILIVEDNKTNMLIARRFCMKIGFEVLEAVDGAEAVSLLQTELVDIVIMDCQMPVMDGFEATRKIRELDNPNARVPIIAVTANSMSRDRDRCLAAGMDDYLAKPMTLALLTEKLDQWRGAATLH